MNGKRHGWIWGRCIAVAMTLAVTLSACISDDDDDPDPTATAQAATAPAAPQASPAASPPSSPLSDRGRPSPAASAVAAIPGGPPRPLPTFPPGVSIPIDDGNGICRAQIPNGWVETTPGRGRTLGDDNFVLFGGRIADDAAWTTAVDLVIQAAPDDAEIEEGDRFVLVTRAEDRGFKYRARFDNIYCDFTVSASSAIPEEEQADWDRIMGSLGPAG